MKILLAASEVAPIIKLGGLGDVAGSLPKALEKLGVSVDVIAPYFPFAKTDPQNTHKILELNVGYAGGIHQTEVYKTNLPGSKVGVILLKCEEFFGGHGSTWKMSNEEEIQSFSFFDKAVVEYVKSQYNIYDLVHCNDWHTGLITFLLEDEMGEERPATLFTIHNLMYQGIGDPTIVRNVGIVPGDHPLVDWDVEDGDLNLIQEGITSADFVNTVSPTYMQEILTPEFGGSLSDILNARIGRTGGILNGLGYEQFPRPFDNTTALKQKPLVKKALVAELGLQNEDTPLFAFVGRIDPFQKGMDILYDSLEQLVKAGGKFVLLGSGDAGWSDKFMALSTSELFKGKVSINIKFDKELAERIYAGSDFLLVPSRYEPCGLIQMIAMWYGSLPIVRATGGLKDSVKEGINGFLFEEYSKSALETCITRAVVVYTNKNKMNGMVQNALASDFSWDKSALEYMKLYEKIIKTKEEQQ